MTTAAARPLPAAELVGLLAQEGDGDARKAGSRTDIGDRCPLGDELGDGGAVEDVARPQTLDLARTAIVAIDPLEAASTYQMLEVQLEAVYTVTARLAGLRFLNYMS